MTAFGDDYDVEEVERVGHPGVLESTDLRGR